MENYFKNREYTEVIEDVKSFIPFSAKQAYAMMYEIKSIQRICNVCNLVTNKAGACINCE
jgi:N-glycosylase/DNA lyase